MTQTLISTRKAYGQALEKLGAEFPDMVVLDAETSNSTFADKFKRKYPDRFVESFIAEQNMVGMALGLSKRGKIPFASTFAAFFSRAMDQIRMSQYSGGNLKLVGSHAGVSIGEDGSSQMALEDLAMFRSILNMTVLYPSDAVSTYHLTRLMAENLGDMYMRTTRADTPVIYRDHHKFQIGGSQILMQTPEDMLTIVAAGITLHQANAASQYLSDQGIKVRLVDLYSIKPLDQETLERAADQTQAILVVEDHYPCGGIFEAVAGALAHRPTPIYSLAVNKIPRSGTPEELLAYAEIDTQAIVQKVQQLVTNNSLTS